MRMLVLACACWLAIWAGCSAGGDTPPSPVQGDGGAAGAGGTDGGFTSSGGAGGGDGGTGGIDECASDVVVAEKPPLDIVIVQDRSGSMSGAKWQSAVEAIKAFADNPGAAGLNVGLTYFPPKLGNECLPATYANLDVPVAVLPQNASAIKTSLLSTSPSGGTPMRPALEGGVQALAASLVAHPGHQGIIILVTDGDPGGCTSNTISNVADVAADALAQSPSMRTFVVGMDGATFGNLDTVASAGGTNDSFDAGDGPDAFVAALDAIRALAIGCAYTLPVPPPDEGTLDLESVSVDFIPGLNEPPIDIPRVDSAADCGEISGGFYYDDPVTPTQIILCDASCELVQSGTENARVDVVLGCILPPPD